MLGRCSMWLSSCPVSGRPGVRPSLVWGGCRTRALFCASCGFAGFRPRPQSIRHFRSLVILRVSGIELPTTKKSSTVQLTERITLECVIRVRVGVRVGAVANQRNGALVFSNPRDGALVFFQAAKWSIGVFPTRKRTVGSDWERGLLL